MIKHPTKLNFVCRLEKLISPWTAPNNAWSLYCATATAQLFNMNKKSTKSVMKYHVFKLIAVGSTVKGFLQIGWLIIYLSGLKLHTYPGKAKIKQRNEKARFNQQNYTARRPSLRWLFCATVFQSRDFCEQKKCADKYPWVCSANKTCSRRARLLTIKRDFSRRTGILICRYFSGGAPSSLTNERPRSQSLTNKASHRFLARDSATLKVAQPAETEMHRWLLERCQKLSRCFDGWTNCARPFPGRWLPKRPSMIDYSCVYMQRLHCTVISRGNLNFVMHSNDIDKYFRS